MTPLYSEADLRLRAKRLADSALLRAITIDRSQYEAPFISAARQEADCRGIDVAEYTSQVELTREKGPIETVSIGAALEQLDSEWPLWHMRTVRHCFDHALVIGRERHNWILHAYRESHYLFSFFLPHRQSMLDQVERFLRFEDSLEAPEQPYDLEDWHALISVRSPRYLLQLIERLHRAHIPLTVQTPTISGDASGRLSLRVPRSKKKSAQNILSELEDDVRTLHDQVQNAFKEQDAERELALYAQPVSFGLQNPAVFYNLGVALYEVGRFSQSSESLIEAISLWLAGDTAPVLTGNAATGGLLGNVMRLIQPPSDGTLRALPEGVAEAEHWLTLLHQRLPHNGDIVRTLAATADLRNDTQRALTLYRSLLDLFPKDEEALSYIRAQTGA